MNALTQYLDLYRQHRDTIRANAPEALNEPRDRAFDSLVRLGRFPEKGDEGYEKISVAEMFAPDFGINITRLPFTVDRHTVFSCALPHIGALTASLVNDTFVPGDNLGTQLPEGVEVMSLARAAELYPDLVCPGIAPADNAVAALNALLVQDGVFLRVRRGVRLDRPVQILGLFNSSQPILAIRRVRVIIEDGASASLLMCDHPRVAHTDTMSCRVVEISLGRDAEFDFYDLEEANPRTGRASVLAVSQEQGSRFTAGGAFINGGRTRNEYHVAHTGRHCRTTLSGLVIGGGAQIVDNATFVTHSQPHCSSAQLFKYAMFDSSQGAFEGLVTVEESAPFTDARQTNRNLLASPDARMHAMPQLIINCDEVKASHGATTGQLDGDALFYMRSRGIPEAEARMMLTTAFLTDVLDNIALEPLRERLRHLVDKRLRGCGTSCDNCTLSHDIRR